MLFGAAPLSATPLSAASWGSTYAAAIIESLSAQPAAAANVRLADLVLESPEAQGYVSVGSAMLARVVEAPAAAAATATVRMASPTQVVESAAPVVLGDLRALWEVIGTGTVANWTLVKTGRD